MTDAINPNYYKDTKIEPIEVIEDWDLGFCLGSALKYIKRCGKKEDNSKLQDLKKVKWYIEREITVEEQRIKRLNEYIERYGEVAEYNHEVVDHKAYNATVNRDAIEKFWEEYSHD